MALRKSKVCALLVMAISPYVVARRVFFPTKQPPRYEEIASGSALAMTWVNKKAAARAPQPNKTKELKET
ncbi:MAG: hypothetical protein AMXMBFR60_14660 [Chloroflexota bacterium]